jgi:hypothetical protein
MSKRSVIILMSHRRKFLDLILHIKNVLITLVLKVLKMLKIIDIKALNGNVEYFMKVLLIIRDVSVLQVNKMCRMSDRAAPFWLPRSVYIFLIQGT